MQIVYQMAQDAALSAAAYTGAKNTAAINAVFGAQDDSHLWPVDGKFNATERAIRKVRREFMECGIPRTGLEYGDGGWAVAFGQYDRAHALR